MLDFNKVNLQLTNIDWEIEEENYKTRERLEEAIKLFKKAINDTTLVTKIEQSKDLIGFNFAYTLEKLNEIKDVPVLPDKFIVAATDGSQITPSHHEIALCYLINVGRILYIYGTGDKPLQESQPILYYKEKDLYTSFKHHKISISEDLIAIERMQNEIQELVKLASVAKERYQYPLLLMVDGSLVNWSIDNILYPEELKQNILERYIKNLEQLKNYYSPICGYISNSRRNEVINRLKLLSCPYEEINCDELCKDKEECKSFGALIDRKLWDVLLSTGQRSPLFMSSFSTFEKYPDYRICFFYLKIMELEVARIEIPLWVAKDDKLVDIVHSFCFDQSKKGYGYPVALSEAHNQAVIKGDDRVQFYSLLSRKMLKQKRRIALSSKELRKRGGII